MVGVEIFRDIKLELWKLCKSPCLRIFCGFLKQHIYQFGLMAACMPLLQYNMPNILLHPELKFVHYNSDVQKIYTLKPQT